MSDPNQQLSGGMLEHLEGLLNELERAGGGPDNEAREALGRLQASLQTLEAVKTGEFDKSDPHTSIPGSLAENDRASIPQQMETLQGKLGDLEQRLEGLPTETKQILGSAAEEWIHEQIHNSSGGISEEKGTLPPTTTDD